MNLKRKGDFPIFQTLINDQELIYLDSSATSQKPQAVIDAVSSYYQSSNANVHRGAHSLSDASTAVYEKSRKTIANFFSAQNEELILVKNTTEATNGLAYGWGDHNIAVGDVIITTIMEHHSSLVVWQQLAHRKKAKLEIILLTDQGTLDLEQLQELLQKYGNKVKLLATTHVSNTLGVINPIGHIGALLKKYSRQARFYVDAAQSVPHMPVAFSYLQKHGVDFLVFSGHKMLGPMGVGCLFVRKSILESGEMKPWLFGGGMIESVQPTSATFHQDNIPELFTAGTPDVASAVGLATACTYLKKIGMEKVFQHDQKLMAFALQELQKNPRVTIIGLNKASERLGIISFTYQGVHAHDVAQILDSQGIAVRSGHHCTMPLHSFLGLIATVRVSFQIYNTTQDVEALVSGLKKVDTVFKIS
jgi:cysteine desulfurase / selenocysteine lyase